MMKDRLVVILIILPIGIAVILAGGILYASVVLLLLNLAALEYGRLFSRADMQIPAGLVMAGSSLLVLLRAFFGFDHVGIALTTILLVVMLWFSLQYERGMPRAATGMGMTLAGTVYLGWLISYFVSLRALPQGVWWTLVVITCVCAADSFALLIGRRWGRHLMAPRLSPKKTWEGYVGGILGGIAGGLLIGALLGIPAGSSSGISFLSGLILGVLISIIAPLGDFTVSMMKREMDRKDTSSLLPGHGGALDRIDSWLVAVPVGYYLIIGVVPLLR
jgi:phosphatidate cytidylyltransferase